jgi:hypothetical protein
MRKAVDQPIVPDPVAVAAVEGRIALLAAEATDCVVAEEEERRAARTAASQSIPQNRRPVQGYCYLLPLLPPPRALICSRVAVVVRGGRAFRINDTREHELQQP